MDTKHRTATDPELRDAAEAFVDAMGTTHRKWALSSLRSAVLRSDALRALQDALERRQGMPNGGFVQLKFAGSSTLYTYKDPSGKLMVGDLVQPYAGGAKVATVAALGKGSGRTGDGRIGDFKSVHAKLEKTDL